MADMAMRMRHSPTNGHVHSSHPAIFFQMRECPLFACNHAHARMIPAHDRVKAVLELNDKCWPNSRSPTTQLDESIQALTPASRFQPRTRRYKWR